MEVGYSRVSGVRDVLKVTSSITFRVSVTDQGSSMERLVDVTGIVDDKTEGKRLLVSDVREVTLDLLVVSRAFVVVSVHEEVGQVLKGIDV